MVITDKNTSNVKITAQNYVPFSSTSTQFFIFSKKSYKNILEGKDINLTLIDTYNISYDEIKDNLDNIHLKVKLCFLSKEEQINKPFKLNIYKPSIQEFYDVINNMNLTDTSKKGYKSKINKVFELIGKDISKIKRCRKL